MERKKKMDSILTPMSCSVWIKYKFCSWAIRPSDYHSPKWPFTREVLHTNYQNSPISPVWPLTLFLTNARENPNKPMNYTNYLKKKQICAGCLLRDNQQQCEQDVLHYFRVPCPKARTSQVLLREVIPSAESKYTPRVRSLANWKQTSPPQATAYL